MLPIDVKLELEGTGLPGGEVYIVLSGPRTDKKHDLCKKVKVRSYTAQYPVLGTAQSTLHFTPWQTCSLQGHFNFSGSIQPCSNYCAKTIRSNIHHCL